MRRRSSAQPPFPTLRRALYLLRWRLYAVCVRLCALVGGRVGTCVVVGGCLVCASGRSVGGSHDVARLGRGGYVVGAMWDEGSVVHAMRRFGGTTLAWRFGDG